MADKNVNRAFGHVIDKNDNGEYTVWGTRHDDDCGSKLYHGWGIDTAMKRLLVALLFLLVSQTAYGAVAFDAAISISGDEVSSLEIVGFTTSGSDRLLTACVPNNEITFLTGVTYNAISLTHVITADTTDFVWVPLYRLVDPTVGSNTITASFSSNVIAALGVMSFNGVHQSVPLGTPTSDAGVVTDINTVVTSAADEIVADCFAYKHDTLQATLGADQTERWSEPSIAGWWGQGSTKAGAASVTMERTWDSSFEAAGIVAVGIKPSGGAAPSGVTRRVIVVE